jgi:thiosulfate reductase cytochrome b subunit
MFLKAPAFLFYPLLVCWSIVFGVPAGMWFKLLSVMENWRTMNRYQLTLWKKYPARSYQKYVADIWAEAVRDKPVELAEYTRHQVEKNHPNEPFPLVRIVGNTVLMMCIAPLLVLTGLVFGPSYVFKRTVNLRRQLLTDSR